ncbi:MAG TPA: polyphosphate kinase 2 family protein [Candidatus Eisenbacteria bacterium]|nr:polyphosphate kinase 2 family protein [Candidatus Eisenbacteria bacterium]
MKSPVTIRPGRSFQLEDLPTTDVAGFKDKADARGQLEKDLERLRELQHLLYADGRFAVLIVLQAMDTGGKDGTIRHVMSGFNPAGCMVTSFKVPSEEEKKHDFLWRIHHAAPPKGVIGVFNRSHYEDVLVVRVHKMVPKDVWKARYRQINEFERTLTDNGTTVIKFFLHISKKEQAKRLKARIEDKKKNWKFSSADLVERKLWSEYQEAYEDALRECSTEYAPWTVIPADVKWARDAMVARVMVDKLETLDLRYPKPQKDLDLIVVK